MLSLGVNGFTPALERQFQHELRERSCRYWRFILLFGAGLTLLFAAWDARFFPEARDTLLLIRLSLCVPIVGVSLRLWRRPLPRTAWIQASMAALTGLTATGVTSMMAFVHRPLGYYVFFPGVMIAMIFLAALMIGWQFVLGAGMTTIVLYVALCRWWIGMPGEVLAMSLFFLFGAFFVALISSFEVERFKRREFLARSANEELLSRVVGEKRKADLASAAKSTFLAAASHDLRQPVQAISNFVAVLAGAVSDDKAAYLIRRIDASLQALDKLFLDLLDISRLDSGLVAPKTRPIRIQDLLDAILSEYALPAQAKGIRLRVVPSSLVLQSDPVLLERVIRNLADNAIRYTTTGSVLIGCRRRGSEAAILVLDTGCGIPRDLQELVFTEFFQVGNAARSRANGFGLGLSIVQRLCALLSHDLHLRSESGRGSSFEVVVRQADPGAAAGGDMTRPVPTASELDGLVVMLIEDELDVRESATLLLELWGCIVLDVPSGDAAIDRARSCERLPDLAIVDFRLGLDETGADAIRMLRKECGVDIPGIILTGDTSAQRIAEAMASGLALVHKPLDPISLRAEIERCLSTARLAESPSA
jgi:signal transduction histidine kinase/CheY-like chemotaxis protein